MIPRHDLISAIGLDPWRDGASDAEGLHRLTLSLPVVGVMVEGPRRLRRWERLRVAPLPTDG